jgi:hypothetical protein
MHLIENILFLTITTQISGTFAWEGTKPTSFILRPAALLRPKSYDHMSYAVMSYAVKSYAVMSYAVMSYAVKTRKLSCQTC